MTESVDKPSLKDIADQDAQKDSAVPKIDPEKTNNSDGQKASAAAPSSPAAAMSAQTGAALKSGGAAVWVVLILVVLGGAVAAGWSSIGPSLEPVIADMRALLGMTPRPTQARLPSDPLPVEEEVQAEAPAEAPVEAPVELEAEAPVETLVEAPVEAPVEALVEETPVEEIPAEVPVEVLADAPEPMPQISDQAFQQMVQNNAELNRTLAELQTVLADMSARIQALEDGSRADPTAPAQALVLGVTQLRSRLMGDGPFAAELAALQSIAAGDATVLAALQRLRPHAEVGVPSEAALTARFAKVAQAIMSARSTSEAEGWMGVVKESLGGLVTVRRTDPAAITDQTERAVAIAEAALELGELDEAVEVLSELQGAPGEAAAAWLGDAQARVDAETALEDLHSHALAVLSAAGGG